MKNREAYYDQLRVLAVISIICCHVGAGIIGHNSELMMHFKTFYASSFICLGRFIGIPVFVMLSGALLINKDYSLSTFIKKRFNRVFVPYLFWLFIFLIYTLFVLNENFSSELMIKLAFGLQGTVGRILWYVWMLVFVYVAIFIINKILTYGKSKSDNFEKIFIAILLIASVICYVMDNMKFFNHGDYFTLYSLFIPYAIFGYCLTHADFTNLKIVNIPASLIVIVTFILSVFGYAYFVYDVCIYSISLNKFSTGSYFEYIILMFTFSLILFFRYLPQCNGIVTKRVNGILSSNYVAKAILSISLCSYGIYFAHYLILNYLQIFILNRMQYYNNPNLWGPIIVVTVFFASWIMIWVMSKIPYLNRLSGAS